jgi:hypothetical protein
LKQFITILSFFITTLLHAQTPQLEAAVNRFDRALVTKDSIALKQILHPTLHYGHSNGWIETKQQLIDDLFNGKINYSKVESSDFAWSSPSPELAIVRSTAMMEYVMDGKAGNLKLHVMQVWLRTRNGWQLVARQSTKIEDKH